MVMDDPTGRLRTRSPWTRSFVVVGITLSLVTGCTALSQGTTAPSFMRTIRTSQDPNLRYQAYVNLGSPDIYDSPLQKADAVKLLSSRLRAEKEPRATRAIICKTLGDLKHPGGRKAVLVAVDDPDPDVRAAAYIALGKLGTAADATTLAGKISTDTVIDCKIAAIEGLRDIKFDDPHIEVALVDGMEDENPAIRLWCLETLEAVTGKDLGVEPAPWRKYAADRLAKLGPGATTTDKSVQQASTKKEPLQRVWDMLQIPSLEQRGLARDKDPKIQPP
jgi:HEAT repeat protein